MNLLAVSDLSWARQYTQLVVDGQTILDILPGGGDNETFMTSWAGCVQNNNGEPRLKRIELHCPLLPRLIVVLGLTKLINKWIREGSPLN